MYKYSFELHDVIESHTVNEPEGYPSGSVVAFHLVSANKKLYFAESDAKIRVETQGNTQ